MKDKWEEGKKVLGKKGYFSSSLLSSLNPFILQNQFISK